MIERESLAAVRIAVPAIKFVCCVRWRLLRKGQLEIKRLNKYVLIWNKRLIHLWKKGYVEEINKSRILKVILHTYALFLTYERFFDIYANLHWNLFEIRLVTIVPALWILELLHQPDPTTRSMRYEMHLTCKTMSGSWGSSRSLSVHRM